MLKVVWFIWLKCKLEYVKYFVNNSLYEKGSNFKNFFSIWYD